MVARLSGKGAAMPADGDDRRSRRSRRLISEALVGLLREKRYDGITVREIIDRADVGRSTFYLHFRSKEEVLAGEFERVLDVLHGEHDAEGEDDDPFLASLGLFRHVQEQYPLYRALVRGHGVDVLTRRGTGICAPGRSGKFAALAGERGTRRCGADSSPTSWSAPSCRCSADGWSTRCPTNRSRCTRCMCGWSCPRSDRPASNRCGRSRMARLSPLRAGRRRVALSRSSDRSGLYRRFVPAGR